MSAPKSDLATIQARRSRLLELLGEGKSQRECARQLRDEGYPADWRTIWRDCKALNLKWEVTIMEEFDQWRQEHILELEELRGSLEDPTIKPDRKVELMLAIIREDSRIKGTAAPTKSITANVEVEHSPVFLHFKKAVSGLSEDQLEEVFRFAAKMPRTAKAEVRDASWFPAPEPKQLESKQ
jgi:hypothetical protein